MVDGGDSSIGIGTDVALSPYTSCGKCASCRRKRPNACQFNQTLGVQRDGALSEFIAVPREKLYPAKLTPKELCLVEPLTVGFHAVSRGRVTADDRVAVFGCGGVGLGAIAGSSSRDARTICIDVDDEKLAFYDVKGGQTLKVRFSDATFSGQKYLEATRFDFSDRDDMDEDEVLAKTVCLEEALIVLPYEKIKDMFDGEEAAAPGFSRWARSEEAGRRDRRGHRQHRRGSRRRHRRRRCRRSDLGRRGLDRRGC